MYSLPSQFAKMPFGAETTTTPLAASLLALQHDTVCDYDKTLATSTRWWRMSATSIYSLSEWSQKLLQRYLTTLQWIILSPWKQTGTGARTNYKFTALQWVFSSWLTCNHGAGGEVKSDSSCSCQKSVALPINTNLLAVSAILCCNFSAISWIFHQKQVTSIEICWKRGLSKDSYAFLAVPICTFRCYWRMVWLSSLTTIQEKNGPQTIFKALRAVLNLTLMPFSVFHVWFPLYWCRCFWFTALKGVLIKVAL